MLAGCQHSKNVRGKCLLNGQLIERGLDSVDLKNISRGTLFYVQHCELLTRAYRSGECIVVAIGSASPTVAPTAALTWADVSRPQGVEPGFATAYGVPNVAKTAGRMATLRKIVDFTGTLPLGVVVCAHRRTLTR